MGRKESENHNVEIISANAPGFQRTGLQFSIDGGDQ